MREYLKGRKFNRLTVISEYGRSARNDILWLCKCDCGKEVIQPTRKLKRGEVKSCGCYRNECVKNRKTTHGYSNTPTYRSWNSMIMRCVNKNNNQYYRYGSRNISVCDRWINSFENFLHDMGERPPGASLDRIDNNGNYEPSNCRWATAKQQQRNRNCNLIFTYNGENRTLSEWCEILNMDSRKVRNKLRYRKYTISELIKYKKVKK